MAAQTLTSKQRIILYDDAITHHAGADMFSPSHWARREALQGAAGGRGQAWFISSDNGEWVIRHYRRGGLVARFNRDAYLWTGLARTRPWREWHLLDTLYKEGLPVPQPVAAQVRPRGAFYRGDLITRRIPDTRSLAALLTDTPMERIPWAELGACIRRFHDAGVYHADLNAHNILINSRNEIFLIDFDRGQHRTPGTSWQEANLGRLQRSLHKLSAARLIEGSPWNSLLGGYQEGL